MEFANEAKSGTLQPDLFDRNKKTAAPPDNAFKLISAQVDKIDRIDYIFAVATPR